MAERFGTYHPVAISPTKRTYDDVKIAPPGARIERVLTFGEPFHLIETALKDNKTV